MERNKYLFICLLILSACTPNKTIEFKTESQIPVERSFNTCGLIEKVNGKEVTKFDYDGNRILIEEDTISCPVLDTSILGKHRLKFRFQGDDYYVSVEVVDKSKPKIKCDKEIRLQLGKSKNDLLSQIKIFDHDKDVKIDISGVDFNKKGNYDCLIRATDKSNNSTEMFIKVIIVDNEMPKNDKPEIKEENSIKNEDPYMPNGIEKDDNPIPNKSDGEIAKEKTFLFTNGYDYDTCYEAALSYAKSIMQSGKANGYNCEPIKNGKEYIGYRVTFN